MAPTTITDHPDVWNTSTSTSAASIQTTVSSGVAYDHEGAMKFIIVTILVYSLFGIVSVLLLRIRAKARKAAHKSPDFSESAVHAYIKKRGSLEVESYRYRLRCEQKKCLGDYMYFGRGYPPKEAASSESSEPIELMPLMKRTPSDRRFQHPLKMTGRGPGIAQKVHNEETAATTTL
ncbi:hypothetical protein LOTGIDRAFT_171831 [Lottia gigantea]|uniref:Uncharacterized protein n=1 Tax=Lottia gigantea TaxID=225164 RepID=V4CK72_LOTGI|nr:hypothetical protein LOTGIDRAFT_171831 [Lottia gigantea]ESP02630.1 hypothetical protein LOTGIDRAFT_171831 [Lottia gigantea]